MTNAIIPKDPYNVIITGVGGQGNVLASRVLGNMLTAKGCIVTIGETFGASQRGGSVMSHLRVSMDSTWSPQIPKGNADMVVALEPTEGLRVLHQYGHPGVKAVINTRPIHSVGVICGEQAYPGFDDIRKWADEMTDGAWFVDATNEAMKMGNPIFGNIMMIGALAGLNILPLDRETFEAVMTMAMGPDKVPINLEAFEKGISMVQ